MKFKYEQEFLKNANQIFKLKGKFGVINYKNIIVIPFKYQLIENIYDSNEFIVKKNNKYGVVNSENKIIENIDYDQFNILKESILFTKTNKRIKNITEYRTNNYRALLTDTKCLRNTTSYTNFYL
ncbi:hypothetical protein FPS14_contig00060-0001 [Flavobacterium psychrophilum]|nr:hypothetical protein FPS14_contig00060-0001 [Flavobacterium psychrophilum]